MWIFEELAIKGAVIGFLAGFVFGALYMRRQAIAAFGRTMKKIRAADGQSPQG